MIRYLANKEIDRKKWDNCIAGAVNTRIYAMSWFLDITCSGWEALVEDDYSAVFPLPVKTKFSISYLAQPFFAQQLGLFSAEMVTAEKVQEFLDAIPAHFRLTEIQLNSENPVQSAVGSRQSAVGDGARLQTRAFVKMRRNHELDISSGKEKIAERYNQNTRRNLKKSKDQGLEIRKDIKPDEIIKLFRENFGMTEGKLGDAEYDILKRLTETAIALGKGETIAAYSGNELCAAVFILKDKNRYIYHLAGTSKTGKQKSAMFLLVDQILQEKAGQYAVLDFEGSDDDNVSRFYAGFGAREVLYPMVRISRLSWFMNMMLSLNRKIQRH